MALFEIHQRFKGHFLNELRVSFKGRKQSVETRNILPIVTQHSDCNTKYSDCNEIISSVMGN